ncbi:MAG TPA: hypothetical protein VNY07_02870 [Chthoniobacterales bacterium]|nr:hypothetical protein [Chthoniobacterales bacterium]
MFKSQQYRAKTAEYGELVNSSTGSDESRNFRKLQECLASLADNEQGLADGYDNAVQVAKKEGLVTWRSREEDLGATTMTGSSFCYDDECCDRSGCAINSAAMDEERGQPPSTEL